ncbi:cytochrome c biogenesis protein DipZ [Amycolatopsis rhabdoformis]|uniref:Cytochrome c biogenesis protein DipZ n=1 Tax=Amycolatopsis rhabdoformis TaxID=1448059 RepID=A0ABZ1ID52_9PSEU|nr:cytochrome c biogenesis protein DipZ [Amycolatopsis rhabdoformis]WSE31661.1 cytochrome c biogenesis protein DipZ [Amycolatopsis rhabdoformis]
MLTLVLTGLLAGAVTGISPCVLPVLPVVLTAGSRRPVRVVAGLVVSFGLATLFGSLVLSAFHLPQDLLRDAGIAALALLGLGLVSRRVGELLERPFARLRGRTAGPDSGAFSVGLALGLVYVPCAGPVLATIAVLGATHRIGFGAVALTAAFSVGAGLPLLALAFAGDALAHRVRALRSRARAIRVTTGIALLAVAVATAFDLTAGLQRAVPDYTAALQKSFEATTSATTGLRRLTAAPEPTGITSWLNTPPLTIAGRQGKVVLVTFWTYSCVNCLRALPHYESWYRTYRSSGLVVLGVHTPEFAFEHEPANVAAQVRALGVDYPVALDNDYATWNAYGNQYWPASYLVDASGQIRGSHFGEGAYADTEQQIRDLLTVAGAGPLPPPTDVPDATPLEPTTPETYLGPANAPVALTGDQPPPGRTRTLHFPAAVASDTFALDGTWTASGESLTAGPSARLRLNFRARTVHLVLGGTGTVTIDDNGTLTTVAASGVPKLYTLVSGPASRRSTLTLSLSPGLQAYDFTFD